MMALDRFGRDRGVSDIVYFYDQPEKRAWHLLTNSEAKVLHDEIARCMQDFCYIARNYYWLPTKAGADVLLNLWDSQEMVWETIQRLKGRLRGVYLLIVKARQLGVTALIDAIIAWICQFEPNTRALLVSYNEQHAADTLFRTVLHIYEQLPWWLRPMIGSRKYEEGIHLINPDPELRRINPGLNSRIVVQGAAQYVGIGEGRTINAAHVSEFGSFDLKKAQQIITGDFVWALPDAPNTFAVLETRVRQASVFVERLWEAQIKLGELAKWYPLFMPIYFDKSHFIAPKMGWQPEEAEVAVKKRAAEEWCVCSGCRQIRAITFGGESMVGAACKDCGRGVYEPYLLQDGQMRWLWEQRRNAEELGEKALIEMQQSLATNPQEAFQSIIQCVFSRTAREEVSRNICPELALGFMSEDGAFHAPRRHRIGPNPEDLEDTGQCWAPKCKESHAGAPNRYLKIWMFPKPGYKYAVGVDVSPGYGGSHDYSVIWVNLLGAPPNPDVQVACYRCNTISSWHLADLVNQIGRWYNNALVVVDHTNHQTTGDRLLQHWKYPNLYRWRNMDSLNQVTSRWHWVWNQKNKESGWETLDGWLRDRSLVVKDAAFAHEMRHFQRWPDGSIGASQSTQDDAQDELGSTFEKVHDDTVTAIIQLIIASHQGDYRRSGAPGVATQENGLREGGDWRGSCKKCDKTFPAQAPCERDRCPFCGWPYLGWKLAAPEQPQLGFKFEEMGGVPGVVRDRYGDSQEFSFGQGQGGFNG